MSNPFELHTPSVFVVGSPFQAVCAIAAIRNLEIIDYCVVVVQAGRQKKVQKVLETNVIKYNVYNFNKYNLIKDLIRILLGRRGRYERIFVGDFCESFMMGVGLLYAKNDAHCVYLDDGNAMISLFDNSFSGWENKSTRMVYNTLARIKGIHTLKNFYTIYADICNPSYYIKQNEIFTAWKSHSNIKERKNIVFVGTNMNSYCSQLELSISIYVNWIKDIFCLIRTWYPEERIVYVPHGAAPNEFEQSMSAEYGLEINTTDTIVEEYIYNAPWLPVAVIGLCSTALLNVKRLMPSVRVVSFLKYGKEDAKCIGKYKSIFLYYQNHDIECIEFQ